MKKYLEYYENEWPENIEELRAIENKPFVGYLNGGGIKYTVVPKQQPDNEIWYTSSNGNTVTPKNTDNSFGASIVSNEYKDGKGIITFDGPVTSIGQEGYKGRDALTSITIPNSVTSIGHRAFQFCWSLPSVTIPNSVTSLGQHAFSTCSALTSITYEGTMKEWAAITKYLGWNSNVPATYVQCSDGQVTL